MLHPDLSFLDDACAAGHQRCLADQKQGHPRLPAQITQLAQDFAALSLHHEWLTHPHAAAHRAALRAQAFSQGYLAALPLSAATLPAVVPALASSPDPRPHTPPSRHHPHRRTRSSTITKKKRPIS